MTGNQQETAINIGFACRLLRNDMERWIINSNTHPTMKDVARAMDTYFYRKRKELSRTECAFIIDGASLSLVLNHDRYYRNLLRLCLECVVVVACRVSPQQKAQLVSLVKDNCTGVRTLAIGDGANDVPMIQSAHVGVGVIGEEGLQAVNNSDFAIGQFRFLLHLLLVHGRWNYYRIAHLIVFTFYKNVAYCTALLWYILAPSGYSGTMIYSPFIQQGYNLFFTAVPIVIYAVTDQDVSREMAIKHPQLYHTGPSDRFFNYTIFWKWIILAILDSLAVLWAPLLGTGWTYSNGRPDELLTAGTLGWTVLCVVVTLRFCIMVNTWNWLEVAGILFSISTLYLSQYAIDRIDWIYDTMSLPFLFNEFTFYALQVLVVVIVIFKDFLWRGYRRAFVPEYYHFAQEVQIFGLDESSLSEWKIPAKKRHEIFATDFADESSTGSGTSRRIAPGRNDMYTGFAFEQPATVMNWILPNPFFGSSALSAKLPPNVTELSEYVLNSETPILFENERFQPFGGFGSSYPGHLLPTDRGKWSDITGKFHAMNIDTNDLEVNVRVEKADKDGWVYARDFKQFGKRESRYQRGLVRRRQWVLPSYKHNNSQ